MATHPNSTFDSHHINKEWLDEVFNAQGDVNQHYQKLYKLFLKYNQEDFKKLNEYAKISFLNQGVTFAVYADNAKGVERIFPFDLFPRIIPQQEWEKIEKGVIQRNHAINLFLEDIYSTKRILKDRVVPYDLVFSSSNFNKFMLGFRPAGGVYNHISGTDLIKHSDGKYYVLEDNVRCPSGVSYVLSNREAMKKTLANIFQRFRVRQVHDYCEVLREVLQSVAPKGVDAPVCVVLTPGLYNSAYYEHSFLAQGMGIELAEGRDMYVENNFVYMKTINGPTKVDVIYRRVDDDFLDPLTFRPDSVLGVPGIMLAYRAGNVTLINAPGTGVSDDKAVYAYIPDIIKYYLQEDPILDNVHTYRCDKEDDFLYVMENMEQLVIKPVDQSGGYGIFIGNRSTREEREELKNKIKNHRRNYIAQPIMSLSVHSTYIEDEEKFEPRHVDLRTYTLLGNNKQFVLQGGLSRVALKKGSLIVNSSQGGGSKDTWVIEE